MSALSDQQLRIKAALDSELKTGRPHRWQRQGWWLALGPVGIGGVVMIAGLTMGALRGSLLHDRALILVALIATAGFTAWAATVPRRRTWRWAAVGCAALVAAVMVLIRGE